MCFSFELLHRQVLQRQTPSWLDYIEKPASKPDIIYADSTKARIYSGWTQGSLFALKIGELFVPEHPPLPRRSLEQWIVKLDAFHRDSATPASPPPQIEKLRLFTAIDVMEDESCENSDAGSLMRVN